MSQDTRSHSHSLMERQSDMTGERLNAQNIIICLQKHAGIFIPKIYITFEKSELYYGLNLED